MPMTGSPSGIEQYHQRHETMLATGSHRQTDSSHSEDSSEDELHAEMILDTAGEQTVCGGGSVGMSRLSRTSSPDSEPQSEQTALEASENNYNASQSSNLARISRHSVLQGLSEALMRRSLTKIDLSQRGLSPLDARLVKMALAQNSQIKVLKLGYNSLGDAGVQTLCPVVAQHSSLESLDIGFNQVGDEGCKALMEAIATNISRCGNDDDQRSWTLYLAGNLIGEDGAQSIADVIAKPRQSRRTCSFRRLYLTGNKLGPNGIKAIADAILTDELLRRQSLPSKGNDQETTRCTNEASTCGGIEELFLGGTHMGSIGCEAISMVLEQSQHLKTISLPNCEISDENVYLLAASIKTNRERLPLESLQLSFNHITCKGMEALTNAVWGSPTLKELFIDNNEIGDAGAQLVAAVMPGMSAPLETLNVGFNKIKSSGMRVLMKAVAESQSLRSLSVAGNSVDTTSSKFIAYALAHNSSLLSISLDHCSIGQDGRGQIVAGIVSNSRTKLREVRGFNVGPVVVTLGFPPVMEHWNNEHVVNFIHLMWQRSNIDGRGPVDDIMDPLHFLGTDSAICHSPEKVGPHEANVVVEVAKKAFASLVEEGVDVFTRRPGHPCGYADASPIDGTDGLDAVYTNGSAHIPVQPFDTQLIQGLASVRARQSFIAPPEESKSELPDPSRKKRIVEWLCVNIQHLNKLGQRPFSSAELWKLHQHYFTPVVNETGGNIAPSPSPSTHSSTVAMSSVPEVSITSTKNQGDGDTADEHMSIQLSDPSIKPSPFGGISPLPLLKRKVSYRFLGDAALATAPQLELPHSDNLRSANSTASTPAQYGSVSMMIEAGPTGHTMPPKTKRARRNRSRISFLPRVKAKLDSYLDVCHEKALVTMRQLYYVEQAILSGQVNPIDPATTARTHLCGDFATDAEMIVCDMI